MILTNKFDLPTLVYSDTAKRLKIPNIPEEEQINNLKELYNNLLLPLVQQLPGEINVTVAYRCHKLNAKVGGKPGSQHTKGMAADVEYRENGIEMNDEIVKKVKELGLEYDQMIREKVDLKTGKPSWIHLSYNKENNRKQLFTL